jgi:hypothetical protein
VLETPLGKGWSPEWVLAGFNHKPGSTAVPTTQDKRFNSINTLAIYLSQHPTYEVPGGTPHTEVTASRAQALHSQLVLSLAGAGQILAEWVRGVRSSNNRVLIQILGVDAGYREYSKSGNVIDELIKGLPAGSTVKVKIIALNGSLEAASGPEAQITLP